MKRIFLLAPILILGFMALFSSQGNAQSDENEFTATPEFSVVVADDVFVRGGPGEHYLPVGALVAGERIRAVARNADTTWLMIPYNRGFGWIRRDLAFWVEFLTALPVIEESNLTPTGIAPIETEIFLLPTATPAANYVDTTANSAYLRAGPGRGYARLGQLLPGDLVDPVGRNEGGSWIMIRYTPPFLESVTGTQAPIEFAWIARNLVKWADADSLNELPIVDEDNLTPTVTFTPSLTPSNTTTATNTAIPTETATSTDTPTATNTVTATATLTETDTATFTASPTETDTATFTASPTETDTATVTNTSTPSATLTDTATASPTATATKTDEPTLTSTASPTETLSPVPTHTSTEGVNPTSTTIPSATYNLTSTVTDSPTPTDTATDVPTDTATDVPTDTPEPTATEPPIPSETAMPTEQIVAIVPTDTELPPSNTPEPSATDTSEPTEVAAIGLDATETGTAEPMSTVESSPVPTGESQAEEASSGTRLETIIAGVLLALILIYVVAYWLGLRALGRYSNGFVVERCPVCQKGTLDIEPRQARLLGIPIVRRRIRCTNCRSVMREMGTRRWRYAIDRNANPAMYDRYNGGIIEDYRLIELDQNPILPDQPHTRKPPSVFQHQEDEADD